MLKRLRRVMVSSVRSSTPINAGEDAGGVAFTMRYRLAFFVRYVLGKTVLLPRDVRSPRWRMLAYETVYSVCRAFGRDPLPMRWLRITTVATRFGVFHVRPGTLDVACASPAFERPDVDLLLQMLRGAVARGRGVVVADVGADIGTYSVTIGNALAGVRIHAFEPSSSSVTVLRRNLRLNGLSERVEVHPVALGDGSTTSAILAFDAQEPGSSGLNSSAGTPRQGRTQLQQVAVSTLDAELAVETEIDLLVVKIDVEGYERLVLEGAAITVARAREAWLLVEDFVDTSIVEYLHTQGWVPTAKRTPYNSFWRRDQPAEQRGPVLPAAEAGPQVGEGTPTEQGRPDAS